MGMMRMKRLGHRGRFFWAARSEGFVKPGLYVWTGETQRRMVPLPRRSEVDEPRRGGGSSNSSGPPPWGVDWLT